MQRNGRIDCLEEENKWQYVKSMCVTQCCDNVWKMKRLNIGTNFFTTYVNH